jgi:rhodanese-related sulfurtransferase
MNRTITSEELKALLDTRKDVTIIDVRRKVDLDADPESVPGAPWRDPDKVEEWSKGLPQDKNVVIYCARGGSVSNKVLDRLLEKKIQARYLEGGIAAWKAAGEGTTRQRS